MRTDFDANNEKYEQKMEETAAARSAAGAKGAEKRWGKSNNDSKNSKDSKDSKNSKDNKNGYDMTDFFLCAWNHIFPEGYNGFCILTMTTTTRAMIYVFVVVRRRRHSIITCSSSDIRPAEGRFVRVCLGTGCSG